MGTSKGNIGRKMYSDPVWKNKIAKANTLKRINVIKICPKCNREFTVERRISKTGIEIADKKEKRHCSRNCSNIKPHTLESKNKISKALSKRAIIYCKFCGNIVNGNTSRRYCSKGCRLKYNQLQRKLNSNQYRIYRLACRFTFNIYDFPNKFDLDLIERFGIYSAKNRGDNIIGISRDHIVSIKYGFKNDISPDIISHPVNCRLMHNRENQSKGKKNGMTIDELFRKIYYY